MSTKTINQEVINQELRLDMSYSNFHSIIDKDLPYKFSYLDDWLLKESKLLLRESLFLENNLKLKKELNDENINYKTYKTYKRGTIIKADFGIGIGSEMSQVHFAIVMNNFDNPKNNTLTVVPLTSKKGKYNVTLGDIISQLFLGKLELEYNNILKNSKLSTADRIKLNKISTLIGYYQSYIRTTFACPSLITTISKERIFKPLNEYDMLGKTKCSKKIMKIIDYALFDRYSTIDKE